MVADKLARLEHGVRSDTANAVSGSMTQDAAASQPSETFLSHVHNGKPSGAG
jgi:hypothetical protein